MRGLARSSAPADRHRNDQTEQDRGTAVIDDILHEADDKMDKSVEAAREEFAAIRAGRAHPSMFNKILVDYYGTPTPLQPLASFTVPEARTVIVAPYDASAMAAIEKAWKEVITEESAANPSFKRVFDSYSKFRADYAIWRDHGYVK